MQALHCERILSTEGCSNSRSQGSWTWNPQCLQTKAWNDAYTPVSYNPSYLVCLFQVICYTIAWVGM